VSKLEEMLRDCEQRIEQAKDHENHDRMVEDNQLVLGIGLDRVERAILQLTLTMNDLESVIVEALDKK